MRHAYIKNGTVLDGLVYETPFAGGTYKYSYARAK